MRPRLERGCTAAGRAARKPSQQRRRRDRRGARPLPVPPRRRRSAHPHPCRESGVPGRALRIRRRREPGAAGRCRRHGSSRHGSGRARAAGSFAHDPARRRHRPPCPDLSNAVGAHRRRERRSRVPVAPRRRWCPPPRHAGRSGTAAARPRRGGCATRRAALAQALGKAGPGERAADEPGARPGGAEGTRSPLPRRRAALHAHGRRGAAAEHGAGASGAGGLVHRHRHHAGGGRARRRHARLVRARHARHLRSADLPARSFALAGLPGLSARLAPGEPAARGRQRLRLRPAAAPQARAARPRRLRPAVQHDRPHAKPPQARGADRPGAGGERRGARLAGGERAAGRQDRDHPQRRRPGTPQAIARDALARAHRRR